MASAEIELVDSETIGLKFAFDANLVAQIRALNSRRWNPKQKRWEVHIAHLAEVMRIFFMHPNDAPPEVLEIYRNRWLRNQLRLIIGNTTSRLSGASIPVEQIDRALSFPVNGHEYSLKFIEGAWDGCKHLFNRRELSFPSGLLPIVQAILDEHGIETLTQEEKKGSHPEFSWKTHDLELRDYQKEAVREAVKQKRGILEMATGAGKTVVAAKIISRLKRQTLFFVHTKDLLYQARRMFEECLQEEIGQVGDGKIDLRPITVATIQTAIRAFGGQYGKSIDEDVEEVDTTELGGLKHELANHIQSTPVIFFDECHHVPAETCYALAMATDSAAFRYGLSATPYRADHHDMLLEAALGPKIFRANSSRLIDMGFLVAPKIRFVPVPGSISRRDHSDYREIYLRHIVDNPVRNKLIADEALAFAKAGKTTLILVREVQHGEAILKLLPKAKFIQGADSARKRAKALSDLGKGSLKILISTTLADEGLDVPSLNAVILAGGGNSETKALQRIGRALRPATGKKYAEIIDFYDQAPYLIDHSRKRHQIYKTEPRFEVNDGGIPDLQQPTPPKNVRYKNKQSNGCLMLLMFISLSLCGLILLAFIGMMAGREDLLAKFVGNSLAMIRIEGPIFDAEDTVDQIRKYARNPRISGIILRIDSPGGTVGASQEIYSAILNAREVKPVYATMGNTAASGGYYIAAAANKIYANPGTVTGSIGVIFELTNLQELVDKIGINFEVVKSGKYKDIGSPMRPLEPQEKLILQGLINDTYEQFVEAIMATRKDALTVAQKNANTASDGFWQNILVDDPFTPPANAESLLRRIADGRLYSGRQALRLGLVDAVGSEGDCITALGKALGLDDPNIIEVKAAPSLMNMLFGESASALRHGALPGAHLSYRMHVEPEN